MLPRPFPFLAGVSVVILATLIACQQHKSSGLPDSYVENGVAWAFGSVQLAELDAPGSVMVKRLPPEQGLNGSRYQVLGTITADAATAAAQRDIAYVDFHPSQERLLAYNYQLSFEARPTGAKKADEIVDIFAILRKGGRSYGNRQRVFLGHATFSAGADIASLNFAGGLNLSQIGNGVYAGQWALHYPHVQRIARTPWQGQCAHAIKLLPGQNLSQSPGQFVSCKPIPPQVDLCEGIPTKIGCFPLPPLPTKWSIFKKHTVAAPPGQPEVLAPAKAARPVFLLEAVADQADVYTMPNEVDEAKVVFVHPLVSVSDEASNAERCSKVFFALGRTVDGQENAACILKPAPASIEDGKLSCGVSVRFERAQTYLEKVCNITGVFRDQGGSRDTVQILKR